MSGFQVKRNLLGQYIVHYDCPHCATRLKSPLNEAGDSDYCPSCRKQYLVPGLDERHRVQLEQELLARQKEEERERARQLKEEERELARQQKELAQQQKELDRQQQEAGQPLWGVPQQPVAQQPQPPAQYQPQQQHVPQAVQHAPRSSFGAGFGGSIGAGCGCITLIVGIPMLLLLSGISLGPFAQNGEPDASSSDYVPVTPRGHILTESGQGSLNLTREITIRPGLSYELEYTFHDSDSYFISVRLESSDSSRYDSDTPVSGFFEGRRKGTAAIRLRPGRYHVSVNSGISWTLRINEKY